MFYFIFLQTVGLCWFCMAFDEHVHSYTTHDDNSEGYETLEGDF